MTTVDPALPVLEHDGRTLDWRPRFDPASRQYAGAPGVTELPTRGRLWSPMARRLDQGREGACCGFAAAGEAAAQPVPVPRVSNAYARGWYRGAQRRDEWPGEGYEGTSVLATMLEGRARGLFLRFVWFFTVEQLAHGIVRDEDEDGGPALAGVEWRAGSYSTDELGVLRPSGELVGGHALAVLGFIPDTDEDPELWADLAELGLDDAVRAVLADEPGAFIVLNSWGATFGVNGLCVVPLSVMRAWVEAGGEFAQPQQRRLPGARRTEDTDVVDQLEDDSLDDQLEDDSLDDQPDTGRDATLHITAGEVQDGDRVLDPPEELRQESVTVRGTPQLVSNRRVRISSTAGTFILSAGAAITVRRPQ